MLRRAAIIFSLMVVFGLSWATNAFALEVGVGEPLAWGPDDVWHTGRNIAQNGLDNMQDLGVQWHRDWISWKEWQPARPDGSNASINQSAIDLLDYVEAGSRQRGIQTYAMIVGAPQWANGSNASAHIPGNGDPANPEFQKFVADYSNFVSQVVAMYRGRIDHWEIWGEPDLRDHWQIDNPSSDYNTRIRQQAQGYAYMLETVYRQAKEANPDCKIIIGGITTFTSDDFLQALYDEGAGPYFDITGIHPYTHNEKPSTSSLFAVIGDMRRVMDRSGDAGKPIWITELGWTTSGSDPQLTVTPEQKTEYQIDALNTVRNLYPSVQVLTFFRLIDQRWYNSTDTEAGFGLLNTDYYHDGVSSGHARYEKKPEFQALKSYISTMQPQIQLQLAAGNVFWANYGDYMSRLLSVDFNVLNAGTATSHEVRINSVRPSPNAEASSVLPLALGDIAPQNTSSFRLKFDVPVDVNRFQVYVTGVATDDSGNVHNFPD